MKEIIALTVFLLLTACVIVLCVKKQLGKGVTSIFLVFALLSGWSIANYDRLREMEWKLPGTKDFEVQVSVIKQDAIAAIMKEAEAQRASLANLVQEQMAGASEKLDTQKKTEETLGEASRKLGESIKIQERQMRETLASSERNRDEMLAVHEATSELALTLTHLIYLQMALKPEPANKQEAATMEKILDGLDQVVTLAIPDPQEREKFISEVKRSIPASP
jgi:hypothetical protein